MEKSRAGFREVFSESAPGVTLLKGAVPGVFLFGIFSHGVLEQLGEPLLDGTGNEKFKVALFIVGGSGVLGGLWEEEDHRES